MDFIIFADLIEDYSSEYNCFGFPIEVNILFKPIIISSGVLFLMGTTSAMLVNISIATSPYLMLEVAHFASISIKSISNSNLAPGETKLLYVLGFNLS